MRHGDPPAVRTLISPGGPRGSSPVGWRRRSWDWLRRIGLLVLTVAVVEYLAVPQLVAARSELRLFVTASPWLLASALVLEACSLASYTSLTRVVLPRRVRPRFVDQLRIDLTGLGASHVVPGGGASAAALRYRLMVHRGIPPADALSTAAVQTAFGVLSLVATFTVGVALALPGIVTDPLYLAAGATGVLLLAAVALLFRAAGRGAPRLGRTPEAHRGAPLSQVTGRLSRWTRAAFRAGTGAAQGMASRVTVLLRHPAQRSALLGWAVGNWLFDAASLWVCLWAYGVVVQPGPLLAAYGAANLVGLLPVTPGGLGVVEGVLVPALVTLGGAAAGPVVLGVLTWRALEFWLPIPVSGLSYLSLRPWRDI
jgi:uncharacterized membrane protein YbhN (UPF0104 family)